MPDTGAEPKILPAASAGGKAEHYSAWESPKTVFTGKKWSRADTEHFRDSHSFKTVEGGTDGGCPALLKDFEEA